MCSLVSSLDRLSHVSWGARLRLGSPCHPGTRGERPGSAMCWEGKKESVDHVFDMVTVPVAPVWVCGL